MLGMDEFLSMHFVEKSHRIFDSQERLGTDETHL